MIAFILPSILPPQITTSKKAKEEPAYKRPESTPTSYAKDDDDISFKLEGNLTFNSDEEEIVAIQIEIADNPERRQRGLMYRTSMKANRGMLFVFENPSPQSFWMENTYIPLDIIFIDVEGKILQISSNVPATKDISGEPARVACAGPVKYVLEVNGGFSNAYDIHPGDNIKWDRK